MHHMFAVGLYVDTSKLVFTELHQFDLLEQEGYCYYIGEREKILLCAGNSCISSPLVFMTFGKIYFKKFKLSGQSAGNFSLITKAMASTQNTYNSFSSLPTQFKSNHTALKNELKMLPGLLNPHFVTG